MASLVRKASKATYGALKKFEPVLEKSWKYSKVEIAPPYTQDWLHGPGGSNLERGLKNFYKALLSSVQPSAKEPPKEVKIEKAAKPKIVTEKPKAKTTEGKTDKGTQKKK